jgi:hypothetical protein
MPSPAADDPQGRRWLEAALVAWCASADPWARGEAWESFYKAVEAIARGRLHRHLLAEQVEPTDVVGAMFPSDAHASHLHGYLKRILEQQDAHCAMRVLRKSVSNAVWQMHRRLEPLSARVFSACTWLKKQLERPGQSSGVEIAGLTLHLGDLERAKPEGELADAELATRLRRVADWTGHADLWQRRTPTSLGAGLLALLGALSAEFRHAGQRGLVSLDRLRNVVLQQVQAVEEDLIAQGAAAEARVKPVTNLSRATAAVCGLHRLLLPATQHPEAVELEGLATADFCIVVGQPGGVLLDAQGIGEKLSALAGPALKGRRWEVTTPEAVLSQLRLCLVAWAREVGPTGPGVRLPHYHLVSALAGLLDAAQRRKREAQADSPAAVRMAQASRKWPWLGVSPGKVAEIVDSLRVDLARGTLGGRKLAAKRRRRYSEVLDWWFASRRFDDPIPFLLAKVGRAIAFDDRKLLSMAIAEWIEPESDERGDGAEEATDE